MNFAINLLEDNDYVIVDFNTKIELLKLRNKYPLLRFKVYTPQEMISAFLGEESNQTLLRLMEKYSLNYEEAKLINQNIIFPKPSSLTPKTKKVSGYRQYLIDNGYLWIDPLPELEFKNKSVLIFPYIAENQLLMSLLNKLNMKVSLVPIIKKEIEITVFDNGIDEIYGALNNISALLNKGVESKYIKLIILNQDYENLLRHFASSYNVQLQPNSPSLLSFKEVFDYTERIRIEQKPFDKVLDELKDTESIGLVALYNLVLSLELDKFPYALASELFKDSVRNASVPLFTNDGIEIINRLPQISDPEMHYFFLSFNQSTAPYPTTSNSYFSNNEKVSLGLNNNEIIGKINDSEFVFSLYSLSNLHLSSAKLFGDEVFVDSPLIKRLNIKQLKPVLPTEIFSQQYLNHLTGSHLDKQYNYNYTSEELPVLISSNTETKLYKSYDPSFKEITYSHNRIKLSFSDVDLYQNVPFDYFAKKILKLSPSGDDFPARFGSFVHKVLEDSVDEAGFIFCFNYHIDKFDFTPKEYFFVRQMYDVLLITFKNFAMYLDTVRPQKNISEEKLIINFPEGFDLEGRMDRILLFERGENKYAVILDFKTGEALSRKTFYEHGLELQLPIYGLLLQNHPKYKEYLPGALVINSMKFENYILDNEDKLEDSLKKSLKFNGIVNNDLNALNIIDPDYNENSFYANIKVSGKGVLSGGVSLEEIQQYIDTAHKFVVATHKGIINNDFRIEAKKVKSFLSSQYSEYKEVSYIEGYVESEEDINE